jgi:NADPH-dependent glutamate synthase beta subunit-like oxidoreductase
VKLPNLKINVDLDYLEKELQSNAESLKKDRARRRLLDLLAQGAQKSIKLDSETKQLTFSFLKSPREIRFDPSTQSVNGLVLEKNQLDEKASAVGTGKLETLSTGLLVKSIGYSSQNYEGIPWDSRRSVVPNNMGRVQEGLYVAGWLKRGPTGTIATTLLDAVETGDSVLKDLDNLSNRVDPKESSSFEAFLQNQSGNLVNYQGWKRIEDYELQSGIQSGKSQEKVCDVPKMISIARG